MTKSDNAVSHDKPCTLCGTPRPVLVRCQIDESGKWHFVCPGKCWTSVSGGVEDAKGHRSEFPHYRYGGMWKNKHADGPLNAKKPQKVKDRQKKQRHQNQNVQIFEQGNSSEAEEQIENEIAAPESDTGVSLAEKSP